MKSMIAVAALCLAGCTDPRAYNRSVAVLVDVSGTYVDQKPEVVSLVKRGILPSLNPGDSLVVVRIDAKSYERDNIEASVHLDVRPSKANAQKLDFGKKLDTFVKRVDRTSHTDIRGAMMLASEYLRETGAGQRTMILFSDLVEDLPKGSTRTLSPTEFEGVQVLAMNVKRLDRDNANPTMYRDRLARWEKTVTASGASEWQVLLDPERMLEVLAN